MLKTMDPAVIRKMLEGHEDILTPEAKAEEAFYRNTQCPMCGARDCQKKIYPTKAIVDDEGNVEVIESPFNGGILPDGYAHCIHCDTDFNPHTGMIFSTEASMIHGPEGGTPHTP